MGSQAKRLLLAASLAFLGQSLSGIFVQSYVFSQGGSLPALVRFNFALYVGAGLAFAALGALVKRGRPVLSYQIGLGLQTAFFVAVLLLGPASANWLEPLGFLSGLGLGSFWLGQNAMIEQFTTPENQASYWGIFNAVQTGAGLAGPLAGGLVIGAIGEAAGYRLVFLAAAISLGAGALMSAGLRTKPSDQVYDLPEGFRDREPERHWAPVLASQGFYGFRHGILMFLPTVLVYVMTGDAAVMSRFAVITGAVGTAAFWLAGRLLQGRRAYGPMMLGGLVQAAGALLLLIRMDYGMLLAYTLITTAFRPVQDVPHLALTFKLMGSGRRDLRIERIVARELMMTVGRAVGMTILLVVGRTATPEQAAVVGLVLTAVTAVVTALFVRKAS